MVELYDRAKLLDQVWSDPVQVVAPLYGLSDVGLKKLCSKLQIPTPPRGYWAKLKAGKRVHPRPKLHNYTGASKNLYRPTIAPEPQPKAAAEVDVRLQQLLDFEQRPENQIVVAERVRDWHPFVAAAREALVSPVIDQRDMPQTRGKGLNISVSTDLQNRALRVADALLKALEKRGHQVQQGAHSIEVVVFGDPQRLRLFEPSIRSAYVPTAKQLAAKAKGEWSYWPNWTFTPSGRLQVWVDDGYGGKIMDTDKRLVEQQLNKLMQMMATRAIESLIRKEQQALDDAKRLATREVALARQRQQGEEHQRLRDLENDAQNWGRAQTIRQYLRAMEQAATKGSQLSPEQLETIRWGRAEADWLDPLQPRIDDLLDEEIIVPPSDRWG
ncbi:hypothetical protein RYA05_17610 [Pseudomonas syringae pv. actinidiae]|uniref:2-polyprenyl-6-methoxyphenol hydroxylase and related FAD-dependent oxidoreductase n=1 Tax=Pseudomonas syringae pv. actinidiae TaxID=103796 RepID=A0AAN4QD51_PSESF|nr:hypothetical protein [Pseudomonas syringae]EPN57460.1 hypothetical protein A235_31972 [Pseudomonas syringae pv. actinidiae ICMP 19079]EPN85580.1 hypothetical protein A234_06112 [Pseudomonas syringae pv. actinidiae ICMP 19101]AKT27918.1 hypothetical protein IYO_000080 [Pseudomonas syringae pv. actinidiae ICMP 18884]AOE54496.1 hypothetical protein NZ708_00080 [Pseudomonas syringae pv. actinidiae ICMP 18708]APP95361.1 hypothetical protein PsaNZ45_00080 [Pseudomonas syringae pv. actinidiae]